MKYYEIYCIPFVKEWGGHGYYIYQLQAKSDEDACNKGKEMMLKQAEESNLTLLHIPNIHAKEISKEEYLERIKQKENKDGSCL